MQAMMGIPAEAVGRILAGGLGALAGLTLLTGGFLVGFARTRWPGR